MKGSLKKKIEDYEKVQTAMFVLFLCKKKGEIRCHRFSE